MNGFSQKEMLYSILGAVVADRKSDTDVKLDKSELVKIGLLNSIGSSSNNPAFSMLSAKMSAEDKIKAATFESERNKYYSEITRYKEIVKGIMGKFTSSTPPGGIITYSLNTGTQVEELLKELDKSFNADGSLK